MPRTEAQAALDWRPGAALQTLRLRAALLARVRRFFAERDVLEVDTPQLARAATTDPAIESLHTRYTGPGCPAGQTFYLHTSPEFFMKRLLAAGSGAVYQLSHVFRDGEAGARHNPEFMMLEWYRAGLDAAVLMDEIDALLGEVLDGVLDYRAARRISYRQWFLDETGLDPWRDTVADFRRCAAERLEGPLPQLPEDELDPWLDLLVTHCLEPALGACALFVHDYPPSQASLARVRQATLPVAERFELYLGGVELANGYVELADAREQQRRFEQDNAVREARGQARLPIDRHLIGALEHGLPDCCGVALGFDRLVMIAAGQPDIDAAMPFALARV